MFIYLLYQFSEWICSIDLLIWDLICDIKKKRKYKYLILQVWPNVWIILREGSYLAKYGGRPICSTIQAKEINSFHKINKPWKSTSSKKAIEADFVDFMNANSMKEIMPKYEGLRGWHKMLDWLSMEVDPRYWGGVGHDGQIMPKCLTSTCAWIH